MLRLKEIPKFALGFFAGFGLVKVSSLGFDMMKEPASEASFYTGFGIVAFSVIFIGSVFYVLSNILTAKEK